MKIPSYIQDRAAQVAFLGLKFGQGILLGSTFNAMSCFLKLMCFYSSLSIPVLNIQGNPPHFFSFRITEQFPPSEKAFHCCRFIVARLFPIISVDMARLFVLLYAACL